MLTFLAGFATCALLLVLVAAYRIHQQEGDGTVDENVQMGETVVAFTESNTGEQRYVAKK